MSYMYLHVYTCIDDCNGTNELFNLPPSYTRHSKDSKGVDDWGGGGPRGAWSPPDFLPWTCMNYMYVHPPFKRNKALITQNLMPRGDAIMSRSGHKKGCGNTSPLPNYEKVIYMHAPLTLHAYKCSSSEIELFSAQSHTVYTEEVDHGF